MHINQVREISNRLCDENNIKRVPIVVNGRMKRTLGKCYYRQGKVSKIDMSKSLIDSQPDMTVIAVLKHEIAHAIDVYERGYSAHDWRWKMVARRVGIENPSMVTSVENRDALAYKYYAKCTCCGKIVGKYYRKTTFNGRVSGCCREKIELVHADSDRPVEHATPKKQSVNFGFSKRYEILCSKCGKVVAHRDRLNGNLIKRYTSRCCGANLQAYDVTIGTIV